MVELWQICPKIEAFHDGGLRAVFNCNVAIAKKGAPALKAGAHDGDPRSNKGPSFGQTSNG